MVVAVIVQVTAVVFEKSWPELVNNKLGKHIFGARAVKYKLGARAGNTNWGPGPGPGAKQRPGTGKYKHPVIYVIDH